LGPAVTMLVMNLFIQSKFYEKTSAVLECPFLGMHGILDTQNESQVIQSGGVLQYSTQRLVQICGPVINGRRGQRTTGSVLGARRVTCTL
jgi:hypothetical protein